MFDLKNIIINDSSENALLSFPDEFIDLVVTSPPYDDLRSYHNSMNIWNYDIFKVIAKELSRVLKPGGVIVWVISDKIKNGSLSCTSMKHALYFVEECKLNLNDEMIWKQLNPMPRVKTCRYSHCYEKMFVFSKGKPKTFNPIMRECKSAGVHYKSTVKNMGGENGRKKIDYHVNKETIDYNIWDIAVAPNKTIYKNSKGEDIKHPAVFPIEIPLRHIKTWSNEGNLVLDPFAGSGTTLIAAKQLNRNYIGIEQNPDYCDIITQRLDNEPVSLF